MEWRTIAVSNLQPAAYNTRKKLKSGDKEYEKIKNSINEFGYVEPIIVNSDMTVISGHQRLTVLKDLGYKEIECVVIEVDKVREKALNIALNKITGAWDDNLLADLLVDLQNENFNTDFTGFEVPEIDMLFSKVHDKDVKEDDFDIDEELKQPCFSKTGDIWHLGKHRIICGDSTNPDTFQNLLEGSKVNLVCIDPPYLVSLESKSGKITNDDLDDDKGYEFILEALKRVNENMADDASIYMFYADSKTQIFANAFDEAGFHRSATVIWKKDQLVLTRTDFKYIHEPITYGWRKKGTHKWYGDQKQTTIVEFPRIKNSAAEGFGHPSSKPVSLIAYLIKQSTMTNGLVLDSFLGSASTLIACEQLDRICYGAELEPKFVDVAVKRYFKFFEDNGEKPKDIYVMRGGQKLTLDEALQDMKEGDINVG